MSSRQYLRRITLCPNDSTQSTLVARVTLRQCLIQEARSDIDTWWLEIKAFLYNLDWSVLSHRHPSRRITRGVEASLPPFFDFIAKFKNKFVKDTAKYWTKSVVAIKLLIPRMMQTQHGCKTTLWWYIEGYRSNMYNSQLTTEIYDDLQYIVEKGRKRKRHATNPRDG